MKTKEEIKKLFDEGSMLVRDWQGNEQFLMNEGTFIEVAQSLSDSLGKDALPTDETGEFILEIDWMSTVEFCDKYGYAHPVFTGDVKTSADQFIRLDAIKWNMAVKKAKEVKKSALSSQENNQST